MTHSAKLQKLSFTGSDWGKDVSIHVEQNSVIASHISGETVLLTFTPNYVLTAIGNNYQATAQIPEEQTTVGISFYTNEKDLFVGKQKVPTIIEKPSKYLQANQERWEGYLKKTIRQDMKPEYAGQMNMYVNYYNKEIKDITSNLTYDEKKLIEYFGLG